MQELGFHDVGEELDRLCELANVGAGHAATALARLVGRPIRMSVPRVRMGTARPARRRSPRRRLDLLRRGGRHGRRARVAIALFGAPTPRRGTRRRRCRHVARGVRTARGGQHPRVHALSAVADLVGVRVLPSLPSLVFDAAGPALAAWRSRAAGRVCIETHLVDDAGLPHVELVWIPRRFRRSSARALLIPCAAVDRDRLRALLESVQRGEVEPRRRSSASPSPLRRYAARARRHHRALRSGLPEVVYGPGKTAARSPRWCAPAQRRSRRARHAGRCRDSRRRAARSAGRRITTPRPAALLRRREVTVRGKGTVLVCRPGPRISPSPPKRRAWHALREPGRDAARRRCRRDPPPARIVRAAPQGARADRGRGMEGALPSVVAAWSTSR